MFREEYNKLNKQINPRENLIQDTVEKAEKYEKTHVQKTRLFYRPIIAIGSMCLVLCFIMPALAAGVEPIYQLMYLVSPSVAQFFMPVQKSDENDGIRMEVVSAYIHENVAEIYITLTDLTQDRMDETIDLFDSYNINRAFDSSAHCSLVGYDESSKTATFLITIEEWGNQNIDGDKITFYVGEFLSHKQTYDDITISVDLSAVDVTSETQTISCTGGGATNYERFAEFQNNPIALVPSYPMDEFAVDGIELTGIGYINGSLHIQTAVTNALEKDNHGAFYFKDDKGNIIYSSYTFYFVNEDEHSGRIDYCNYVFDIPQNELSSYTLHGDFVTTGMKTKGPWKVTFPLKKPN